MTPISAFVQILAQAVDVLQGEVRVQPQNFDQNFARGVRVAKQNPLNGNPDLSSSG